MDRHYKPLWAAGVKARMALRLPAFATVRGARDATGADVFVGSLAYRRPLDASRSAWVVWSPGPGVERYFHVALGWRCGGDGWPWHPGRDDRRHTLRTPYEGVGGGTLDLEQIEGRAAIGGITIPSPWDAVAELKPATPAAVQRDVQRRAQAEALALGEADRQIAVDTTLDDVLVRLEAALPGFVQAVLDLPAPAQR